MNRKEALDRVMSMKQGFQERLKQLRAQEKEVLKYTDNTALFLRVGDNIKVIPFPEGEWRRVFSGKIGQGDMYYDFSQHSGWSSVSSLHEDAGCYTCVIRKLAEPAKAPAKKAKASGVVDIPDGWAVVFNGRAKFGDQVYSPTLELFHGISWERSIPAGTLVIRKV